MRVAFFDFFGRSCVFLCFYVDVLIFMIWNGILFGDGVFNEVISLNEGIGLVSIY